GSSFGPRRGTDAPAAEVTHLLTINYWRRTLASGTVYTTAFAHHSVAKAARLAGIRAAHIRTVPCTGELKIDIEAAAAMISADRRNGLRPFLIVGTAGTTDTGTIDPLVEMADLAQRERMWMHVDAAYGGFFRLTERGRDRLAGTERADSITLDPHKTLFLPFGTGALVVRDSSKLYAAHEGTGDYLQDTELTDGLPDFAHMGPELSREVRGLRAWLPLHLHGVSAFREALNEKLDLTQLVYETLTSIPELEVPQAPDLSTVIFRFRALNTSTAAADEADRKTRLLLDRINSYGSVLLSSTVVNNRQTIRVCVVAHRTHHAHVAKALEIIACETAGLADL
ncbi:pyridoxal phosphate-dependent decarboxylase family protein, partial [Streptomyces sp. NPDC048419]|uniref:pyridoxal phosphate-dependent decarboxylase family protein n=1 Tax=Streptomyces sp. NPDC048419 TaxID=3365547 RepID=UPI003716DE2F